MSSSEHTFLKAFRGEFWGVLKWPQLDDVWSAVLADAENDWYVYALGEAPPSQPATAEQLALFVREIDILLRHEHAEDYCGIVYVDNFKSPQFIKIFDPNQLGSVCGSGGQVILPGWLLCKIKPVDLSGAVSPTQTRKRWWRRLFH